jgi:hypothetical protein
VAPAYIARPAPRRPNDTAYELLYDRLTSKGFPAVVASEIRRSPVFHPGSGGRFRRTFPYNENAIGSHCDPVQVLEEEGFFSVHWEVIEVPGGDKLWNVAFFWDNT